ncbi:MAG: hypothetical protein R3A12_13815 [Ignavibacteria bacterium]
MYSENSVEFTYSHINAENKIVWSPASNGLWTPQNIGLSESNVFMFDINSKKVISDNISVMLGLSYTYTQALKTSSEYENDPTYNKQIFYIPEEMAKLNFLNYYKSGLNLFYTFTGSRYTNFENTESLSPVDLLEANVFQNFSVYNINSQIKFGSKQSSEFRLSDNIRISNASEKLQCHTQFELLKLLTQLLKSKIIYDKIRRCKKGRRQQV